MIGAVSVGFPGFSMFFCGPEGWGGCLARADGVLWGGGINFIHPLLAPGSPSRAPSSQFRATAIFYLCMDYCPCYMRAIARTLKVQGSGYIP